MINRLTSPAGRMAAGALALALAAAPGVFASSALAQSTKPVAKVGDMVITEADIAYLQSDNRNAKREDLINRMIDWAVMAQAAEKAGLDKEPEFKNRMAFLRRGTLRSVYFVKKILPTITPEDIDKAYKEKIAGHKAVKQVRARHILVKTEEEAKAVIKMLDEGGDFAKLAAEKSIGPSKSRGGDLNFFDKTQMVPPFANAAFALEKGAYTKAPVKTRFGWHVIKVEDMRDSPPPTLASMSQQLRQQLMVSKYEAELKRLKDAATIEIIGAKPDAKKEGDAKMDGQKKASE